jgi:hypothetical protein
MLMSLQVQLFGRTVGDRDSGSASDEEVTIFSQAYHILDSIRCIVSHTNELQHIDHCPNS